MMDYLLFLEQEELTEAAKPLPISETGVEAFENEHIAAVKAEQRINRLEMKTWTEMNDDIDDKIKFEVGKLHKEKLARYRQRKDWEAWVEEDEIDMEGDRLLSEIRNFKSEHFYNTGFYM